MRLATVDANGYPDVTPLWFLWADGAFHVTSRPEAPHLDRLARDPRVGVLVDVE